MPVQKIKKEPIIYKNMYGGRDIIDTNHSIEQYLRWYPRLNRGILNSVVVHGMKRIIEQYGDVARVYIIHSISTKIGAVVSWKRWDDARRDDKKNHAVIVTFLKRKDKHVAKHPDKEVVLLVEKLAQEYFGKTGKHLREEAKDGEVALAKFGENDDFIVTYLDGELYDFNAVVIHVK